MRPIIFSLYGTARDTQARPLEASWDEWREVLTKHELRGSPTDANDKQLLESTKDGPCVVLGRIEAGKPHTNANVLESHAVGLDIENATMAQVVEAYGVLQPYEFVVATTHKHATPHAHEDPERRNRIRIILPFREAVSPSLYDLAWKKLYRLLGPIVDRKTGNVGRLFYLPSTVDLSLAWSVHNPGEWLDVKAFVADSPEAPEVLAEPIPIVTATIRKALRYMREDEVTDDGRNLKALSRKILVGEPFAEPGDRHTAMLAVTMWLAQKLNPAPPGETVYAVLSSSLAAMEALSPGAPTKPDVERAWNGAVEKVELFERERTERKQAERAAKAEAFQLRGLGRYTDEELERIATAAEVEFVPGQAAQALQRRWLVHAAETSFYILDETGNYKGPFGPSQGRSAATDLLARAPVLLNEPTQKGFRRRSIQELVEDYGTVSSKTVIDLTRKSSVLSRDGKTLFEAARPIDLATVPRFDPEIDRWLRLFAGPVYEKLLDWLACVPDLSRLLCALYISGGPGSGKTLLAHGIARLWAGAPASFELVFSAFNEEIVRCPLILADEDFGAPRWARQDLTGQIRSMISTLDRTVTRKYQPPSALLGAVRLIIAANNDYLLSSKESLSSQDLEAIAQRFLYLKTPDEAADFLASIPAERKESWKAHGIADHVLWLSENREVKPGRRFAVEGDITQMHRLLTVSSEWTSRVSEWLVRLLQNPKRYTQRNDGYVRLGDGRLLVNEQAIIDGWSIYLGETRVEPETAKIGAALRALSEPQRTQLRYDGHRIRYRVVNPELLYAWSDTNGIETREVLERALWGAEREPGDDDHTTDDLESIPAMNQGEPF